MNSLAVALAAALSSNPALSAALNKAINTPKPGSKFAHKRANKRGPVKAQSTEDRKAAFQVATLAAFTKAGYAVTASDLYVNIKPFKGFAEEGMTIKDGQTSVRVKVPGRKGKGMPLFHRSQFTAAVDPAVAAALNAEYGAQA